MQIDRVGIAGESQAVRIEKSFDHVQVTRAPTESGEAHVHLVERNER
jgi:hypothetical protein